jgi:hypothetical protein
MLIGKIPVTTFLELPNRIESGLISTATASSISCWLQFIKKSNLYSLMSNQIEPASSMASLFIVYIIPRNDLAAAG